MLNLFKKLNPTAFLISFIIGMIYVYYKKEPKRVVYRHPNLNNAGKTTYQNSNDECYKYNVEEVNCPHNHQLISEIPIQLE